MKLTIAIVASLATLGLAQGPPPSKGKGKGKGMSGGFGGKISSECISCFTSTLQSSGCQMPFGKMGGKGGKMGGKGGKMGGMPKMGAKGGKMGGPPKMGGQSPVFPPPGDGPAGKGGKGKGGADIMKGVTDFRDCMCKASTQSSIKGCVSKCGSSSGGAAPAGAGDMVAKMCSADLSQLGKGMPKMSGMGKMPKGGKMGGPPKGGKMGGMGKMPAMGKSSGAAPPPSS